MDISQYRADNLLTSRDPARELASAPVSPVSAISKEQVGPQPTNPEEDGLNLFDTLLDTVNPLQNIPGVSTAYQAVTGDESGAVAKMAGGFLFGGPVGLAAGAATSFFEFLTGKSLMEHAHAFFGEGQNADPVEHFTTATVEDARPLSAPKGTSLSVVHYQEFASAKSAQSPGIGANANDVAWSSNMWTDSALRNAADQYEQNQNFGEQQRQRSQVSA